MTSIINDGNGIANSSLVCLQLLITVYNVFAMKNNSFYTVEQVADLLQVHWQTVLNYIKSGKLEAVKLGRGYRISKENLDQFISTNSSTNNQRQH
jgi:excisionase family DNA binding protein